MIKCIKIFLQYLLPHHGLSRFAGKLAHCQNIRFKNFFIDWFIKRYGVDMSIALETDPHAYSCFNDFFIRVLDPAARPIAQEPGTVVSPADGAISQIGAINDDAIFQAKGHNYDLTSLLGGMGTLAEQFKNGSFMTVYLSPKDYHRVHMPSAGRLVEMVHVPGKLFSVNPLTVASVPNLFARNERVVCLFATPHGPLAVILVGAMLVASMSTAWAGKVSPPAVKKVRSWKYLAEQVELDLAEEMGHFTMGSTVIVLYGPGMMNWRADLAAGSSVQMGELIGNFTSV